MVVKLDLAPEVVAKIAAMDDPSNMSELTDIGRLAAKVQLKPEHFPPCFDVTSSRWTIPRRSTATRRRPRRAQNSLVLAITPGKAY
ncbi:hypothetical protein HX900_21440 [Rhizobium sp. WYCCWR 11290]|uniref:Uncharacterized protein n=1 Tax=Rhizobium changzhiense TaxID=2692317 RepID=A0A7Z0RLJ9_9HYPH|nr:hypothetical protein [Rhizobium changzhiense]NZD63635.1 hypothetical protein [Rhizobium changzhiense]